ncbi:TOM1-like protein 2 isoform X1 [Syngnathus scovelli]|uniref:TOM1-like protein 2 isoform X1 n=1 Tax=Syngnathus scovelli TaxID=161590 RepID=UPI00211067C6|nr:TOM1-like protein 2 isoform X1 [Syngnathus scovelli]
MEFLLGNPYSTPVGQCIERATEGGLQNEDWALNMEICDIINETDEGPKDAMRALRKRLGGNKNYGEVLLALTVVETCVKNCGHRFHLQVASRDFIDGVLVKIISPKANPPTIVQDKVLSLIQAWADAFRSSPDLTGVVHIYEELKRKGTEFPMADLDALSPIHTPQRGTPEVDPAIIKYLAPASTATDLAARQGSPHGPITATPQQVARLRSELDIVRGNIKVLSEMLMEMVPGQEDGPDLELFQELHRTCRAMQQRVVELISRVSNEEVTEELLHVNDDLNNIFLRYERYERCRSGRGANNKGILGEETNDNLIDLGPGSPAVVTPRAASSPPPRGTTGSAASPVQNPAVGSLSSALAGLDVSPASPPSRNRDDFDMFAQTRTSSLAEQRKNVKYEDPRAVGGLASALDVRQHNAGGLRVESTTGTPADQELPIDSWLITQGMIPVSQSSVMDDIEEWLSADVKGDPLDEGVTSEEFDKFLEERAKASDTSLPGDNPAHPALPTPVASHKKAERTEDALFAL